MNSTGASIRLLPRSKVDGGGFGSEHVLAGPASGAIERSASSVFQDTPLCDEGRRRDPHRNHRRHHDRNAILVPAGFYPGSKLSLSDRTGPPGDGASKA